MSGVRHKASAAEISLLRSPVEVAPATSVFQTWVHSTFHWSKAKRKISNTTVFQAYREWHDHLALVLSSSDSRKNVRTVWDWARPFFFLTGQLDARILLYPSSLWSRGWTSSPSGSHNSIASSLWSRCFTPLPLVELLNSFYSVSLLNYWTVTCLRYWTCLWSFSLMRVDSWTYFFLILPRNRYYLTSPSLFIHSVKQLTPVSHAAPSPISSWTYLLMRKKSKSRLNQLLLLLYSLWMRL